MAEPGVTEPTNVASNAATDHLAATDQLATDAEASKAKKNRVKKLKSQYVAILDLEARAAAGQALDAGQAAKVSGRLQGDASSVLEQQAWACLHCESCR